MGIRDDIQTDLAQEFSDDLADAVTDFTLTQRITEYDTTTGGVTESPSQFASRGVFSDISQKSIRDENNTLMMVSVVCLQNEIATRPGVGDTIEKGDMNYRVGVAGEDPASATYKMRCVEI